MTAQEDHIHAAGVQHALELHESGQHAEGLALDVIRTSSFILGYYKALEDKKDNNPVEDEDGIRYA